MCVDDLPELRRARTTRYCGYPSNRSCDSNTRRDFFPLEQEFHRPQQHHPADATPTDSVGNSQWKLGQWKNRRPQLPPIHQTAAMPTFQSNKFRGAGEASRLGSQYRRLMNKHPFAMFGLPFLAVVVAGSFVLTPATAIRYERHDRKVRQMTKEEEFGVRRAARKVDMKEEYYVSPLLFGRCFSSPEGCFWSRDIATNVKETGGTLLVVKGELLADASV